MKKKMPSKKDFSEELSKFFAKEPIELRRIEKVVQELMEMRQRFLLKCQKSVCAIFPLQLGVSSLHSETQGEVSTRISEHKGEVGLRRGFETVFQFRTAQEHALGFSPLIMKIRGIFRIENPDFQLASSCEFSLF